FILIGFKRIACRFISQFGCAAKGAASPVRLMPGRATWALALFFLSRLHRPALWVINRPGCAAKSAASPVRLMPGRATWALALFLLKPAFFFEAGNGFDAI